MGDGDPCLGTGDGFLPVLGEAPAATQPGEGALDDPPFWQNLEALGAIGEDMAQPGKAVADGLQQLGRAVAVLDIGAMDDQCDQKAQGVGDDMALAALDLLAGVKATDSAAFGGLDRLAVDRAG